MTFALITIAKLYNKKKIQNVLRSCIFQLTAKKLFFVEQKKKKLYLKLH